MATRVLIRLHEIMHVEVEVSAVFDAPTVARDGRAHRDIDPRRRASQAPSRLPRVPRRDGLAPASFAQERLWNLQNLVPDLPFFNTLYALRVTSPCDAAVLERSINEIVRRHEILRTTFAAVDGRCMQVIAPQLTVPLAFDDLRRAAAREDGDDRTRIHQGKSCLMRSTSSAARSSGHAWCASPSAHTSCS